MGTHPIFESDFDCLTLLDSNRRKMSESESGEEFDVEEILDDKIEDGEKMYLIKWRGYSQDDNTWEPISNLDCPDNIANYEREKRKKKRRKTRKEKYKKRKSSAA